MNMKSSTLFQDRLQNYSRRERCPNIRSMAPFALTFLFIASIFSLFLLYSPNPFSLFPNQTSQILHEQQDHLLHKNSTTSKADNESKMCDLSKGKWVRALRRSYYTNSSCELIPDSKNCFKHGRKDEDFLNWRWKPEKCELPEFDPKTFLHIVRGKKMAFVGDSVARNHMDSLLCLLSQEEMPTEIYKDPEDRYRKWYFPKHDFTLMALWSRFLIVGQERMVNGTGSSIFDLKLDQLDDDWVQPLSHLDYAIFSTGHWFFRIMYLHEGDKQIGCVYCNKPNVTNFSIDFPIRMAFRRAFKHINECQECKKTIISILRTFAPAHFEHGFWNTGGYCNRTGPKNEEEVDLGSLDWHMRNAQIEEFEKARDEGHGRFDIVDVTRAMLMRADGHPGAHWGNKWMRGYNDCTHWCMPGPIDVWSEILLAILRRVN